jgi:hypothetical protein
MCDSIFILDTMEIQLFNQLSTCSKRCAMQTHKRWGHKHYYRPRWKLLQRLARENNMSEYEVEVQLHAEVKFLKSLVQ